MCRLESRLPSELPAPPDFAGADCLIVDTFPRGLGGELVDALTSFVGTKVLVARDLNPRYVAAVGMDDFVACHYDLVLSPGDMGPGVVTAPWLVRSADELLPRRDALSRLGLTGERPCILVCAAGNHDELSWYGAVVTHLLARSAQIDVRAIASVCPPGCPAESWVSYWPAVDLYNAADVVIGGAGYNTVYECLAYGVPLVARPWPRKYDRQRLRAARAAERGCVTVMMEPEQAATAALRVLGRERRAGLRMV